MKLERHSFTPLYRQLKKIILEWIHNEQLGPGERIPPEREIARRFGVSRLTARQAIAELVSEGVLYRIQGSGTYLTKRRAHVLQIMVSEQEWVLALREAERHYNEVHPDNPLHVEVQVVGRPQLRDKIIAAVAAGRAPDIALIDWVWMAELTDLQFFISIDMVDPHWTAEYLEDLLPGIRAANHHSDGHLYGVQADASAAVLWYRKDWFAAEGLPPPCSWEDLVLAATHLKSHRKRYGLGKYPIAFCGGIQGGETTTFDLLPFLWSVGGDLVVDRRVVLNDYATQTLEFLADLVHTYQLASPQVVGFPWDEPRRMFAQGKVAIALGGSYEKRAIQDIAQWDEETLGARVGMVPIPAGPGGSAVSVVGGMIYTVFRQTKLPEIAVEFLTILASPSLMKWFCDQTGRVPSRRSVAASMDTERWSFQREVQEILGCARPRPASPQYAKISMQFRLMVENTIAQRMPATEAVQRARNGIEAILAD